MLVINLPKPKLTRKEALDLWISTRSDYAKEQVVLNNTGLVIYVMQKYNINIQDEDTFMTGIVGLLKALDKYDPNKNVAFATYAMPAIRNQILMSFRKKEITISRSLDEIVSIRDDEICLKELIADTIDVAGEVIAEIGSNSVLDILTEKERKVVDLRLGGKKQREIARMMHLSQSYVSRILKSAKIKYERVLGGLDE
mgnify:CR=1 FL=1